MNVRDGALFELFEHRCASHPSRAAVTSGSEQLTFLHLSQQVDITSSLISSVARSSDVLALDDASDIAFVITYLAALKLGMAFDLSYPAAAPDATVVLRDGHITRTSFQSPAWRQEVDGACIVIPTSGTSGHPKRVLHGADGLTWNLLNTCSLQDELSGNVVATESYVAEAIANLEQRSPLGLVFMNLMPLRTIAGLSVLGRALFAGEHVVLPTRATDPASIVVDLQRFSCTNLAIPPLVARRLLRVLSPSNDSAPKLLAIGIGGSRLDPALAAEVERRLEAPVTSGYGSTELGGVTLTTRPWDTRAERWESVGRPLVGTGARIDQSAQLWCKNRAAARGVISGESELVAFDTWMPTGDRARSRPSGAIEILGRLDYLILRAGHRIDPARVEAALLSVPGVANAAALGAPSRLPGEEDVVAIIVAEDGRVDEDELRKAIRERCLAVLRRHEVPRRIVFTTSIPLAPDGVPKRSLLPSLLGP